MATKTTEVPSKDRAAAVALLERGGPYTPAEIAVMDRGSPRPDELVNDAIDRELQRTAMRRRVIAPSIDPGKAAIDEAVSAEFGEDLQEKEQAVAAAAQRRIAAEEKSHAWAQTNLFKGVPPEKGEIRHFMETDLPEALRSEQRSAKLLEEIALKDRADLNEKIMRRRRELAAPTLKK